jgi:SAM-dependent methyltransferase
LAVFIAALSLILLEIIFSKALLFTHSVETPLQVIPIVFLGLALGSSVCLFLRGPALLLMAQTVFPWALLLSCAALLTLDRYQVIPLTFALALPFFCAGIILAEGLRSFHLHRIYFFDLAGAGAGVLALYFLLPMLGGEALLIALFGLMGLVGIALMPVAPRSHTKTVTLVSGLLVMTLAVAGTVLQVSSDSLNMLRLAQQKMELPQTMVGILQLRSPKNKLLHTRWGLIARIDVIESQDDPIGGLFRNVPFPEDSEFAAASQKNIGKPSVNFFYNDFFFSVISKNHFMVQKHFMLLHDKPDVLIIGVGGGDDIERAREAGANRVVAVEINPETVELMRGPLAEVSGQVYDKADDISIMDGRSYVHDSKEKYDVISLFFADLYVPFPGSNVFLENYLYTVEAFGDYLKTLKPGGLIYVGKWLNHYDENVELFRITSTARQALLDAGYREPEKHMLVMGLDLSGGEGFGRKSAGFLLIKQSPFTKAEVDKVVAASPAPYFPIFTPFGGKSTAIGDFMYASDKSAFLEAHASDVSPTCDDRPFFYEFDRAHSLQTEMMRRLLTAMILFLLPPLFIYSWKKLPIRTLGDSMHAVFFILLGLGYGMLQISLIQRFNLFLGSPIYSMLTIFCCFLLLGGLGSLISSRWNGKMVFICTALMIALFGLVHWSQPFITGMGSGLPYGGRCLLLSLFLLAPCVLLGVPFPAYMRLQGDSEKIAFYYAINSASLVLGTLVSLYLSMVYGFSALLLSGLGFYLLALIPMLRFIKQRG